MNTRSPAWLLAITLCLLTPAAQAVDQAQASTISGGVELVRPASDKPFAELSLWEQLTDGLTHRTEPLETTSALQDGDGLRSDDVESAVQLECASGATLTLSGTFDVVLRTRVDGKGCRLEVRKGLATATTAEDPNAMPDGNPEFQYGDVTLGAASTLFGVSIDKSSAEAFVIDGVVTVKKEDAAFSSLNAGQVLSVDTGKVEPISEARYEYVASAYAKLDVVNLPAAQRAAKQVELRTVYIATFKNPDDAQVRAELTSKYATLPAAPNAARAYQMRKQVTLVNRATSEVTTLQVPDQPQPDKEQSKKRRFQDRAVVTPQ